MQFRIRYSLYRIEAKTSSEAKEKAISILSKNLEEFVSVEEALEKRPLWRMLIMGR